MSTLLISEACNQKKFERTYHHKEKCCCPKNQCGVSNAPGGGLHRSSEEDDVDRVLDG